MTIEENLCTEIFQDLLNKRCIVSSQIIEEKDTCRYFCVKPPKTIVYHPDMKGIHRNSIIFCLLHEEKHNRHPVRTVVFFLFIAVFLIFLMSMYHISFLLLFAIIPILGVILIRREEYECDEFAAISIKNELNIEEQPSEIIKRTLEIMPYNWLSAITHPSRQNRIKKIAERFDKKP
ncbi:MAG: M48 family metalloprotease [Methanoregula sp.]